MSKLSEAKNHISVKVDMDVKYICPECHEVFKPALKEAFWANHTPTARKLTCAACGHKGFCVEVWGGDDK